MLKIHYFARLALVVALIVGANLAVATPTPKPAPGWSLVYSHIDGDDYVVDHDLTLDDCLGMMGDHAGWGYACSR